MNSVNEILGNLNEVQRGKTLEFAGALADPLTRRILAKLASNHSPISVDNIPTNLLNAQRPEIISRLSRLERYGLVSSNNITKNGTVHRRYEVNKTGKDLVHKYMKEESKNFA